MKYRQYFKRPVDLVTALLLLVVISPIFLCTWLVLMVQNAGKPFFFHKRPGKDLRSFHVIKFKTMSDERDEAGNLLPDIERMTFFGKWIRKLSLDELPQLINVLRGEMSLIGPRPLLFRYVPLYSAEQNRRHEVRPGITGWAQVNGRNSISWERKFELDIYYVDHIGFALDAKIFWLTILKVLKREGVNQSDARPMQPFDGTN